MKIRTARPDERTALIDLQRRAALANPGDRDVLLANPDAIDTPADQFEAGNVVLAEDETGLLGFSAICARDDGDAELDGLFVAPEFWKKGIGRALVEAAAARASQRGAARLHVVGNPHAEGFYVRLGFEITGMFATRFGDGLLMVREARPR